MSTENEGREAVLDNEENPDTHEDDDDQCLEVQK